MLGLSDTDNSPLSLLQHSLSQQALNQHHLHTHHVTAMVTICHHHHGCYVSGTLLSPLRVLFIPCEVFYSLHFSHERTEL